MSSPRLILASASPRRRQLLEEAGYAFDTEPPDADEEALGRGVEPAKLPVVLASHKAGVVAERHRGEAAVVLAADTVVYSSLGEPLGKPLDADDARRMLRLLSGSLHAVVTAFTCTRCDDGAGVAGRVRSDVLMRPLSEDEIEAYVASEAWRGKAGGYGIQDEPGQALGQGDPFIERISGELTNIVGLPMPQVIDALRTLGVGRSDDPPFRSVGS